MNSADSISAFERMEAKANQMLDSATAEAELSAGTNSTEDLAKKYASPSTSVDDELARMKQELGI